LDVPRHIPRHGLVSERIRNSVHFIKKKSIASSARQLKRTHDFPNLKSSSVPAGGAFPINRPLRSAVAAGAEPSGRFSDGNAQLYYDTGCIRRIAAAFLIKTAA